jgi:hypothetical protein
MAKKKKSERWTKPTVFSKFLAIMLFILLPLVFFWFGMYLQKAIDQVSCLNNNSVEKIIPTPTVYETPNF